MSARPPAKEKARSFCYRARERLQVGYQAVALLQGQKLKFVASETELRCCVECGVRVTNQNLGGHHGRSALSGDLWCLSCADGRREQ